MIVCHDVVVRFEVVGGIDQVTPENDNADVFLYLEDGRVYGFVVATPNNIYWCMQNDGVDYFFGVPPLFVERLTFDNIERVLSAILRDDDGKWLSVYGALQKKPD